MLLYTIHTINQVVPHPPHRAHLRYRHLSDPFSKHPPRYTIAEDAAEGDGDEVHAAGPADGPRVHWESEARRPADVGVPRRPRPPRRCPTPYPTGGVYRDQTASVSTLSLGGSGASDFEEGGQAVIA